MPSSWPIYTYLVFAAALGILLPFGLGMISRVKSKPTSADRLRTIGERVYLRFFVGSSTGLLLIAGTFLLLPVVTGMLNLEKEHSGLGMGVAIPLLVFLLVGLFYAVKKGELAWRKELMKEEESND